MVTKNTLSLIVDFIVCILVIFLQQLSDFKSHLPIDVLSTASELIHSHGYKYIGFGWRKMEEGWGILLEKMFV